jgi:hypothetical protein
VGGEDDDLLLARLAQLLDALPFFRGANARALIVQHEQWGVVEEQAIAWLAEPCSAEGFAIQPLLCDVPTAFLASCNLAIGAE